MKPLQLLLLVWVRRRMVLGVLGASVALVLVVNLFLPRTYVAATSVVVNARATDPITGQNTPGPPTAGQMATQLDVISSRNVALKVVDALRLTADERFAAAQAPAREEEKLRQQLAARLQSAVKVHPASQSSVIRIEFAHADRELAAALANAFADAYLETNLELRLDPAKRQTIWFDEQLQGLRATLERAQQRLTEHHKQYGIVDNQERLDVENARLEEIARQLTEAQQDRLAVNTRLEQMQAALDGGRIEEVPEILGNPLLQSMKAELVRAEGRLAEIGERYGSNYPQHQSAAAEVRSIREKMQSEIARVHGAAEQALAIATRQENEITRAFDEQKAKILRMQNDKDAAAVLNREVQNVQRTYDEALQRAGQVRLESRLDQMDVSILDRAVPPLFPSSPRTTLNLVFATVFGAMLAVGVALLMELGSPRVRLARDVFERTGVPVLAELPSDGGALRSPKRPQLPRPSLVGQT